MNTEVETYIFSWTELLEAIAQGGCTICNAVEKKLDLTYQQVLREEIINPEYRTRIKTGLGFCLWHAHKLLEIEEKISHDHYLTALYYADLLTDVLQLLKKTIVPQQGRKASGKQLTDLFSDTLPSSNSRLEAYCRICQAKKTHEEFFMGEFLRYMDLTEFVGSYRQNGWLCFPHLSQAVNYPLPTRHRDWVISHQLSRLERLIDELKTYQEQIFKVSKTRIADWINSPEFSVETVRGKLI